MARKKKAEKALVEDYWNENAKRKNIPPAGLAARGQTIEIRNRGYF